jgi:hypothetical protein
MIEASQSMTNSPLTSVLIAGISIAKSELIEGRTYNLETFKPNVGGFITFGSGAFQANYTGRFSTPNQGLLTARAARASRSPAIPSIQIEGVAQTLTGMVNLSAVATPTKTSWCLDLQTPAVRLWARRLRLFFHSLQDLAADASDQSHVQIRSQFFRSIV